MTQVAQNPALAREMIASAMANYAQALEYDPKLERLGTIANRRPSLQRVLLPLLSLQGEGKIKMARPTLPNQPTTRLQMPPRRQTR